MSDYEVHDVTSVTQLIIHEPNTDNAEPGQRRQTLKEAFSQGLQSGSQFLTERTVGVLEDAGDSLLPAGTPDELLRSEDDDMVSVMPVPYQGKQYRSAWKQRIQRWLPRAPEGADEKPKRVYWIDLMRIIACMGVPIVHSINYAGKAGTPVRWDPNYTYCGWNQTTPEEAFVIPKTYELPQHAISFYMERRYMAGFTLFFFASGAALYMSSYFIKNSLKFGISRFVYLLLMIIVGVLTCLVPANAIFYGARTFNELFVHFNMLQHLGFLVTLIIFTVAHIPVAVAMRRRSVTAYIIWGVFFAFLFILGIVIIIENKVVHRDVGIMLVCTVLLVGWIVVSSLFDWLIYCRAFVTTVGHALIYSIPADMDEVWREREKGVGNMATTIILVGCMYWVPFTLAMYVTAFKPKPNKALDNLNLLALIFSFTLGMEWSIPLYEPGWMEAYSIRTYSGRFERCMYMFNMYWTIWFLYTLFNRVDGEPFKRYIALGNTFVLVLYIWHPVFLSIGECYFVVPIGQNIGLVPHLVEIGIMYLTSMVGCGLIHAALHWTKIGIGKMRNRKKTPQTMSAL